MRLPPHSLIAPSKLHSYLLKWRRRNDKSGWLARAGYTQENWRLLEHDLRTQLLPLSAKPIDSTEYGQMYEIKGNLIGPNGVALRVCSVWITEKETKQTKFVTLYPYRGNEHYEV